MEHVTIGRKYNEGKVAFVKCVKDGSLRHVDIQGKCFLLMILTQGKMVCEVGGEKIVATAPAFLCFDETENPVFVSKTKAHYICVYFHPRFLNVNMTFDLLRSAAYDDIATTHDMFLLKPFIDRARVIPICESQIEKIERSADYMIQELEQQRDWYWSCRGRSYFMEIIIALERMYGLIGYGQNHRNPDNTPALDDPKLRGAVLYIEGHYDQNITLSDIASHAGINHTSLTARMKQELGCTAIEYLMRYRITVSQKQLAFTNVPIKDVAGMVGFKTVQHFTRIFKEYTGTTPAEFRKSAVQKRKDEIK